MRPLLRLQLFLLLGIFCVWLSESLYGPYWVWFKVRFPKSVVGVICRMFVLAGVALRYRKSSLPRGLVIELVQHIVLATAATCVLT